MPVFRVFEYSQLTINKILTETHFKQLVQYNEIHGNKFFNVGNRRIYFKNYVGVLQVGNLVIEILPKADKSISGDATDKWHNALIYMLHICGYIKINSITRADLKLQNLTLIDLFYRLFIDEVKEIIHQGLIRKYRYKTENRPYLKGRLIFNKHISENLIHKEKFYTSAQVYDHNNSFNQILLKALRVLKNSSKGNIFYNDICNLIYHFDDVDNIEVNDNTFENLQFTRNNLKYKSAITLARLILQNYSPDLKSGTNNVIGLLFDMNLLFERVVYKLLKKQEVKNDNYSLKLSAQASKPFWSRSSIRPDIFGEFNSLENGDKRRFIIDTKWKRPQGSKPGGDDLKQMYVYNLHFGSHESILLYPDCDVSKKISNTYHKSVAVKPDYLNHSCSTFYIDLFEDDGKLKNNIGDDLFRYILESSGEKI